MAFALGAAAYTLFALGCPSAVLAFAFVFCAGAYKPLDPVLGVGNAGAGFKCEYTGNASSQADFGIFLLSGVAVCVVEGVPLFSRCVVVTCSTPANCFVCACCCGVNARSVRASIAVNCMA